MRINLQAKFLPQLLMIVDLSIGNGCILVLRCEIAEGLHSLCAEIVEGQPMETNETGSIEMQYGMVRSSWLYPLKAF